MDLGVIVLKGPVTGKVVKSDKVPTIRIGIAIAIAVPGKCTVSFEAYLNAEKTVVSSWYTIRTVINISLSAFVSETFRYINRAVERWRRCFVLSTCE